MHERSPKPAPQPRRPNAHEQALAAHPMTVIYQPEVDGFGQVRGLEALGRWEHRGGKAQPGALPLPACATDPLVDQVCTQLLDWTVQEVAVPRVGVSLSACDLQRPDLLPAITRRLERNGIAPHRLVAQVAEQVLDGHPGVARKQIEALREAGVSIAIDAFGRGGSPLSRLRELPIDMLKVDPAFMAGVPGHGHCERALRAMADLGEALGVRVVMTGVAHIDQLRWLRSLGLFGYQGPLFHRPAGAGFWTELLRTKDAHVPGWEVTSSMSLLDAPPACDAGPAAGGWRAQA